MKRSRIFRFVLFITFPIMLFNVSGIASVDSSRNESRAKEFRIRPKIKALLDDIFTEFEEKSQTLSELSEEENAMNVTKLNVVINRILVYLNLTLIKREGKNFMEQTYVSLDESFIKNVQFQESNQEDFSRSNHIAFGLFFSESFFKEAMSILDKPSDDLSSLIQEYNTREEFKSTLKSLNQVIRFKKLLNEKTAPLGDFDLSLVSKKVKKEEAMNIFRYIVQFYLSNVIGKITRKGNIQVITYTSLAIVYYESFLEELILRHKSLELNIRQNPEGSHDPSLVPKDLFNSLIKELSTFNENLLLMSNQHSKERESIGVIRACKNIWRKLVPRP